MMYEYTVVSEGKKVYSPRLAMDKGHESEYAEEVKNPGLDVSSLSRAVRARKDEYTRVYGGVRR
jgi:hypothetical protein